MTHGDGVEGRAREALREAMQMRIFGEKSRHALLELCDLGQLAELGFVIVEEGEKRLGSVNSLGLGRELANDSFEDGTSICIY